MSLVPRHSRGDDPLEETAALVQGVHEEARRHALEADSARWRAGALAEAIFGEGVVPRLRSARGASGFRALVELEVPFTRLERHRELEERFLGAAHRDEILSRIPTVFVFTPAPARAQEGGAGAPAFQVEAERDRSGDAGGGDQAGSRGAPR